MEKRGLQPPYPALDFRAAHDNGMPPAVMPPWNPAKKKAYPRQSASCRKRAKTAREHARAISPTWRFWVPGPPACWILSLKPITPQFNRLNPISGLANLFSKQQMANVAKMVLMTAILSYVAWKFMGNSIDTVAMLVLQPSPMAIRQLADWLTSGMSLLLLVVFLAALVDVPLQAYFFKSRLKMSHEEVKQEHKESDGNPHTKGRIRQKQREIADRASVGAVPKADFVVMNPAHYAVALKYDEKTMSAPQVISRGTDLIALKIRDVAKAHDVPVLQS